MIPHSTPIGTPVVVQLANGTERATTTRTKPWPLATDTWVVAVNGLGATWPWFMIERVRLDARP